MKKTNGKHINERDQQERRRKIIRLREQGKSNREISNLIGYCPTHVSTIWQRYLKAGCDLEVLNSKVRGRKEGDQRRLSLEQEIYIKEAILNKTPQYFALDYYLWCRDAVRILITSKFGVKMPLRLVTDYLSRWGLNIEKPIKKMGGNCDKQYNRWLNTHYKSIADESYMEGREIIWIRDCEAGDNYYNGLSCRTELTLKTGILSSVSNHGNIRFLLYKNKITENKLRFFISSLYKDTCKKICLIFASKSLHKFINIRLKTSELTRNLRLEFIYF